MAQTILNKLIQKQDLSEIEASKLLKKILNNELSEIEVAGILVALKSKGESIDEITGFAKEMRKKMVVVNHNFTNLIDTCGTGGDQKNTFNISTISSFVAAAAGCKIAKHGNRAVSGKTGSADLLESFGARIDLDENEVKKCIEDVGIGFLFAPKYHLSMKNVSNVRKTLGIKTIFNIIGPLSNPAMTKKQLIGVYSSELTEIIADVLNKLGSIHSLIVHGMEGLDEISISTKTKISELKNGKINTFFIQPEDFKLKKYPIDSITVKNIEESKKVSLSILNGEKGAARDIVILNAAAAIYISGKANSILEGVEIAREVIDSKKALKKLKEFVEFTNKIKE